MYNRIFTLLLFTACTPKQTTPQTVDTPQATDTIDTIDTIETIEKSTLQDTDSEECPEGVKTGCNVPDVTQSELVEKQSALDICLSACPEDSPGQTNQDCVNSCQEEHFIGQVEVVPDLEIAPE